MSARPKRDRRNLVWPELGRLPPLQVANGGWHPGPLTMRGELRAQWVKHFGHEDLLDLALIEIGFGQFDTDEDGNAIFTKADVVRIERRLRNIVTEVNHDEPMRHLVLRLMRGADVLELTPADRSWPYWIDHLRALGKAGHAVKAETVGRLLVPTYWPWLLKPTSTATEGSDT